MTRSQADSSVRAIRAARIFDGSAWHDDAALVFADGKVRAIEAAASLPAEASVTDAGDALVVPGFVDLQVNGGGGVLLNEQPTADGIATICAAHAKFGTTALLPTLITDTARVTGLALQAGSEARQMAVPGFLGLHLEGPHLAVSRKGAHDPQLIRPMQESDIDLILSFRHIFDVLMTTIAPENVSCEQVARLAEAGIVVSLGHTDASYDTARLYAKAGVRTVTHLFNAMSPLGHREPGLVGAALDTQTLYAGMIADTVHVHPAAMGVAIRSKTGLATGTEAGPGTGSGKLFLVTDAMSPIGTDMTSFTLNGREILRRDGRLTLADGTLAGADIDMISSVRNVHETLGLPLEEALRMASTYPAEAVGIDRRKGALKPGFDADFVVLTPSLRVKSTWIDGNAVHRQ